jgi:hypothetical protein
MAPGDDSILANEHRAERDDAIEAGNLDRIINRLLPGLPPLRLSLLA